MGIMPDFVGDFAGDVLNQSAAECDVQDLDSAADCHHGLSEGLGCLDEGYLGTVPFLMGRPYMQHAIWHFDLPVIGLYELPTATFFDLGVYLIVLGTLMTVFVELAQEGR